MSRLKAAISRVDPIEPSRYWSRPWVAPAGKPITMQNHSGGATHGRDRRWQSRRISLYWLYLYCQMPFTHPSNHYYVVCLAAHNQVFSQWTFGSVKLLPFPRQSWENNKSINNKSHTAITVWLFQFAENLRIYSFSRIRAALPVRPRR